jgi:hypothetical protein
LIGLDYKQRDPVQCRKQPASISGLAAASHHPQAFPRTQHRPVKAVNDLLDANAAMRALTFPVKFIRADDL